MYVFKTVLDLQNYVAKERKEGKSIGFTPTMGALHQGHMSLLKISKTNTDISICSVFVNPTQFNDEDDLKKYPRPIVADIELLEKNGCNALFLPSVEEVYFEKDILLELLR